MRKPASDSARVVRFILSWLTVFILIILCLWSASDCIDDISRNEDENIRYKQVIKQAEDLHVGRPSEGD
jgi:hypothetical protein